MTWSYNPASIQTSPLFQVRLLVGDNNIQDPLVQDEEILWALTQRANVYGAGAEICRAIAARFSRQADSVSTDTRIMYSARSKAFASRAAELDGSAKMRSAGFIPFAGGISQTDKAVREADTDRVRPAFEQGDQDNLIPVTPVEHSS